MLKKCLSRSLSGQPRGLPAQCAASREAEIDAARCRALKRYKIVDTPQETDYSNIVQLAAQIFDSKFAAISFIEAHRQWFKAGFGLDVRETPLDQSFCKHAIDSDEILVVKDTRLDPTFSANPLVNFGPKIRFYAGIRLLADDGTAIGTLCVFDDKARPMGISSAERTTLRILVGQVQSLLELRRSLNDRDREATDRERLTRKLQHVADHDVLTGLPHRGPFQLELDRTFKQEPDPSRRTALVLIDVDHFKQVNDAMGHAVGDALLCNLARRLRRFVRKGDCIGRIGGDEFAVILRGITCETSLADLMQSVSDRLQQPLIHDGREVKCGASIGVALYPDHSKSAEELMKFADLALAEAKNDRGCAVLFTTNLAHEFDQERAMLTIAARGLNEARIVPFYQPKVELRNERIVGFEALIRCQRDGDEPLQPASFSQAFNEPTLARALGKEMMNRVLDDIRFWANNGFECGSVAINSCAADFQSDDFAERLIYGLESRRLKPHQIELEVTEGVFLGRGAHHVARALWRLHSHGVRIALDDFGTGYASLTHLKQFPIDAIKIDRSFVTGIGRSADDTSIVKALAGLARNLGIETIAEGVETVQQSEFLRNLGCDIGQGFLFGKAVPAEAVPLKLGSAIARAA